MATMKDRQRDIPRRLRLFSLKLIGSEFVVLSVIYESFRFLGYAENPDLLSAFLKWLGIVAIIPLAIIALLITFTRSHNRDAK
jgi:hypothetical protein